MDQRFSAAIERTLSFEGGYVNDVNDPGGETKFGICKRSYPRLDIKNLTREKAIEIYYSDFWKPGGYALIANPAIAAEVFDMSVNAGPARGVTLLQQTLNRIGPYGLAEDGRLGMHTLEAVNDYLHQAHFLAEFKLSRIHWYVELAIRKSMQKFLAGWIRRALA